MKKGTISAALIASAMTAATTAALANEHDGATSLPPSVGEGEAAEPTDEAESELSAQPPSEEMVRTRRAIARMGADLRRDSRLAREFRRRPQTVMRRYNLNEDVRREISTTLNLEYGCTFTCIWTCFWTSWAAREVVRTLEPALASR